jgi:hypothetical protein
VALFTRRREHKNKQTSTLIFGLDLFSQQQELIDALSLKAVFSTVATCFFPVENFLPFDSSVSSASEE